MSLDGGRRLARSSGACRGRNTTPRQAMALPGRGVVSSLLLLGLFTTSEYYQWKSLAGGQWLCTRE